MNLSPNFTLSEMTKSETALRNNLDNTPGETEIANLKLLCCKRYATTTAKVSR
jgi:hypothetical protein